MMHEAGRCNRHKVTPRIPLRGCGRTEGRRVRVADRKSRQRLECVCLKHRFPFTATRQASPHGSQRPEAKAPVKPDALHTLARATQRLSAGSDRFRALIPRLREEPLFS